MISEKILSVPIDQLEFDRENPRLVEFNVSKKAEEEKLIEILCNVMAVDEIILSIVNSGFFQNEPLIAVKEKRHYVVVEGNRQLAAVKVITNYGKYKEYYPQSVPPPSRQLVKNLQMLPVLVEDSRKDTWQFIGFKHVNGPAKWGSYAKAQYIAQVHNQYGIPLEKIAAQIGDTNKTVQRLYQALMVIDQAERKKKFDKADVNAPRLYFSHLYTGLQYEGFKQYLDLKDNQDESPNPVSENKLNELGELLELMYGSKKYDTKPVIVSQNPDLRHLEEVLKSPQAMATLRETRDLSFAFEISQPDDFKFSQSLNEAKRALYKALQYKATGYQGDEDNLKVAGSIANMAEELYETMEKQYKKQFGNEKKKRISE